jgi:hypothetical protein
MKLTKEVKRRAKSLEDLDRLIDERFQQILQPVYQQIA